MPPKQSKELSLEDVEFLQVVRYIEDHPDEFDDGSERPGASTSELRSVLEESWETGGDWSKGMIAYRMSGPDKSDGGRGWDEESGFGLVRLHSATLTDSGWTARRVELTDRGRKRLSQMEERMGLTRGSGEDGDAAEFDSSTTDLELKLERLQDRVEELEEEKAVLEDTVQSLAGDVNSFKGTRTGALDNDVADRLREVFNLTARQKRLNQMVFNIDSDPFDPEKVPTDEDIRATKASVQNAVLPGGNGGTSSGPTEE